MQRAKLCSFIPVMITCLLIGSAPAARADEPDPCTGAALTTGSLQYWPLHERAAGDTFGAHRTGLWNTIGEFQRYPASSDPTPFLHSGIDISGSWNSATAKGDLVRAVASGDIWAALNFTEDTCTSATRCRIYIKSTDRRHIFYYSHLNVRDSTDSDVRSQLEIASMLDPEAELEVGANPVTAGQKLAGLGLFSNGYTHLHFSIFDACENYDGLNPLALLPAPTFDGQDYVDETSPVIDQLVLLREDGSTLVTDGSCSTPLSGTVDLVVEAKDAYHDLTAAPEPMNGTDSLATYKARYRIKRTPSGSAYDGTWYEHDRLPFRCRGQDRGTSCSDPVPLHSQHLDQHDFIVLAKILTGDGPHLGITFVDTLFNLDTSGGNPYSSSSAYWSTERYFHLLTHEWGYPDHPGRWDTTTVPNGRYQVSVEVADQAGNATAAHRFVVVQNGGTLVDTGDLVVRDNPDDVGAVPSTLGGQWFWISPDIKVTGISDPDPTNPNDSIWDSVQDVNLIQGQSYEVWVRVENRGCETIDNVQAKVAFANPQMIQTDWAQIDTEKSGGSLTMGAATVIGPFSWTPTEDQTGHRCLLVIARADQDQPTVSGFASIQDGWGGTVANDNNISQLNLQVAGTAEFSILNPGTSVSDIELSFDCRDFPIYEDGSVAELIADYHPALASAWAEAPRTELRQENNQLVLRFLGCRMQLPAARLAGGTVIPASFNLELEPGPVQVFRVDLGQEADGTPVGGMSFTITRTPPIY
jgi:hypothetical protein